MTVILIVCFITVTVFAADNLILLVIFGMFLTILINGLYIPQFIILHVDNLTAVTLCQNRLILCILILIKHLSLIGKTLAGNSAFLVILIAHTQNPTGILNRTDMTFSIITVTYSIAFRVCYLIQSALHKKEGHFSSGMVSNLLQAVIILICKCEYSLGLTLFCPD